MNLVINAEELERQTRVFGRAADGILPLLAESGHVDVLERRAAAGDYFSAKALAETLGKQGDQERALEVLAPFRATGWWPATRFTASLLDGWDRGEEAAALLGPFAASGGHDAIRALGGLLVRLGRPDQAFDVLRSGPENLGTVSFLVRVLDGHGHDDQIEAMLRDIVARAPFPSAIRDIARVFARQDRVDDAVALLRSSMVMYGGTIPEHVELLASLLAQHGRITELKELAALPDCEDAVNRLARWHAAEGDLDAAREVLRPFIEDGWSFQTGLLIELLTAAGADVPADLLARNAGFPRRVDRTGREELLERATTLIRQGRAAEALDALDAWSADRLALAAAPRVTRSRSRGGSRRATPAPHTPSSGD